jgi:hypothetical protein
MIDPIEPTRPRIRDIPAVQRPPALGRVRRDRRHEGEPEEELPRRRKRSADGPAGFDPAGSDPAAESAGGDTDPRPHIDVTA